MRKFLMALAAGGALLAATAPADAAQGCGAGFHRGPYGRCIPNRGPGYGRPRGGPVIGTYYPGRGYYYNNRYWHKRYRHHGGWRYR